LGKIPFISHNSSGVCADFVRVNYKRVRFFKNLANAKKNKLLSRGKNNIRFFSTTRNVNREISELFKSKAQA
jgi:hypothetical protein